MREILAEHATPPILVFPNWDAVANGLRPFHVYCDACIGGFGHVLEQKQEDGSIKPIVYISRATLYSERRWTLLDLEAGSIVWVSNASVATFGELNSAYSLTTRHWRA